MTSSVHVADLKSRAVIAVSGPDWRAFLQSLLTQDVETLGPGEIRFAGLLTPQGRLLYDLFVVGGADGCLIDCAADHRQAVIQRLTIYRLRAKVAIELSDAIVTAAWGGGPPPAGFMADPRLPALGWRGYDAAAPADAVRADESAYDRHRLSLGVPGPADWGSDAAYPIEADFDLLAGIDFRKGCFVGQETTSRMKRRGAVKSRMVAIAFKGDPLPPGAELLAGTLRAGHVLSGVDGLAMALVRLDRLDAGPLTLLDGRPWRPLRPEWLKAAMES
jgi:folate-binding protein YgfZ